MRLSAGYNTVSSRLVVLPPLFIRPPVYGSNGRIFMLAVRSYLANKLID